MDKEVILVTLSYKPLNASTLPSIAHLMTPNEQSAVLHGKSLGGYIAFAPNDLGVGVLLYNQQRTGLLVLQSIVVSPSRRRCGIGTAMLLTLGTLARKLGRLLVCPFPASHVQDPLYRFFASTRQFSLVRQSGSLLQISREEVETICVEHPLPATSSVLPFGQQSPAQRIALAKLLETQYANIAQDLTTWPADFDPALCFCQCIEHQICAAVLMKRTQTGACLSLFYAKPNYGKTLFSVLLTALHAFSQQPDCPMLTIPAHSTQALRLFDQLCHNYQIDKQFYIAYARNNTIKEAR